MLVNNFYSKIENKEKITFIILHNDNEYIYEGFLPEEQLSYEIISIKVFLYHCYITVATNTNSTFNKLYVNELINILEDSTKISIPIIALKNNTEIKKIIIANLNEIIISNTNIKIEH